MSNNFLAQLQRYDLLNEHAESISWFLSEKWRALSSWKRGDKRKLANQFKKIPGFRKDHFSYGSEVDFATTRRDNAPVIAMKKGDGQAMDWIRHLRNAIAHGNVELYFNDGQPLIEGKDFNQRGGQSAYFAIPLSYLNEIVAVFNRLTKTITTSARHK